MISRKRKAIFGFLANLGGTTFLQLLALIVTPLYLELTSQELFGIWLTFGSIISWMSLSEMGIGMALTRKAISALEKKDYILLKKLINAAIISFFMLGLVFVVIGSSLTNTLIRIFDIKEHLIGDFSVTYNLLLLVTLISQTSSVFGAIITAKQHIATVKVISTSLAIFAILINIVLLKYGFGIISFSISLLTTAIIAPIISIYYLKYIDSEIIFTPFTISINEIKSLFKLGGLFQLLKVANLVSTSTDNIIIASFLGVSFVSIYTFTSKLAFFFAVGVISIIPVVLFPGLSQLFEIGNYSKIRKLYFSMVKISLRIGIMVGVFFYCVNEIFVDLWVGSINFGGEKLSFIFVLWILIECFLRGITSIIYASSKIKKLAFLSLFEASFNIIFTLIFVNEFGLVGVAFGTVLSRLVIMFPFVPYFINKILDVKNLSLIKNHIIPTILYSLPSVLIVLILNPFLKQIFNPVIFIFLIGFITLIFNILFFEVPFLIRQKNKSFIDRISLLKSQYS